MWDAPLRDEYRWRSVIVGGQVDVARPQLNARGLRVAGEQRAPAYHAEWSLDVDADWATRRVSIAVAGDGWSRTLELWRDADRGSWHAESGARGEPGALRAPGITEGADLDDAIDCDLALCPMTNLMPIRRLSNNRPESGPLVMAWIDMPSLAVYASDQHYRLIGDRAVRYESGSRDFVSELTVDGAGMVLDYPQLASISDDRPAGR